MEFDYNLKVKKEDRRIGIFYLYYDGPFYGIDLWFWNFTIHDQPKPDPEQIKNNLDAYNKLDGVDKKPTGKSN
jgi:hypothetical protein